MTDFSDMARAIIESNRYMVLGTADAAGVPWVTPVWYAQADYRRFIWVSAPDRKHSRNVGVRPEVSPGPDANLGVGGHARSGALSALSGDGVAALGPRSREQSRRPRRGHAVGRRESQPPAGPHGPCAARSRAGGTGWPAPHGAVRSDTQQGLTATDWSCQLPMWLSRPIGARSLLPSADVSVAATPPVWLLIQDEASSRQRSQRPCWSLNL
jgi:hypothetical protein